MRILVIEDDTELAESLKSHLKKSYAVDIAVTGQEGIYYSEDTDYDLILIDISLPDISGVEVCKTFRAKNLKTPVVMLTGRVEDTFKVSSFESGADDYVTKPFSYNELDARLHAILRRRAQNEISKTLTVGKYSLDTEGKAIAVGRKIVRFTPKEFAILELLMRNKNKIVKRDKILENIWDDNLDRDTNLVDVYIRKLRCKIGKGLIKSAYGFGYKVID